MKLTYAALSGALVLFASNGQAQQAAPSVGTVPAVAPAPVVAIAPIAPANQAILRVGTPVPLRMSEALTTEGKKLRVGQRFRMETAEPILVDGQVVIPVGSLAIGEVTDVRNKGMWGKSGRINGRVLYVQANGRQIRLSGQLDDKGTTGTAGVVASVALVPIAGFFVTGTSARIPMGGAVTGVIDEDVPLTFAAAAPAAMVVGSPSSATTVTTSAAVTPAVATTAATPAATVTSAVATGPAKAD